MKASVFGASLLLAFCAAVIPTGCCISAWESMGYRGEPPERKQEQVDQGNALLERMVGRWDVSISMGEDSDKSTLVRELIRPGMLVETMTYTDVDGSQVKVVTTTVVDGFTGAISFTTVSEDHGFVMYGTSVGSIRYVSEFSAGSDNQSTNTVIEEVEFLLYGCSIANVVRVRLGVSEVVGKDGTKSATPWEEQVMHQVDRKSGEVTAESKVATIRLTPTVIPDVPDVAAMMAAGTPGEPHKRLATYAGEWTSTFAMTPKGMPPMEFPGTASCEMVMGGRFLREKVSYDMGDWGKQDMELLHGFNNTTGKYELTLFSSDSTNIMTMQGEEDEKTKVITFDGKYYDFTVKDYIGWRAIVSPVKDGKSTTKLLANYGNEWTEMGVITYTKAPAPAGK